VQADEEGVQAGEEAEALAVRDAAEVNPLHRNSPRSSSPSCARTSLRFSRQTRRLLRNHSYVPRRPLIPSFSECGKKGGPTDRRGN
jgi:hypothetical protein